MADRFQICHAYQLLEANYNVGGWLRERPSNQRRRESIGCQLLRLGFNAGMETVELWPDAEYLEEWSGVEDHDEVRFIYFQKVLEWGLPYEDDDRAQIERLITASHIRHLQPNYVFLKESNE